MADSMEENQPLLGIPETSGRIKRYSGISCDSGYEPRTPLGGSAEDIDSVDVVIEEPESPTVTIRELDYDVVLESFSSFSCWHAYHTVILWLVAVASGINTMTDAFTGLEPDNFNCFIGFYNTSLYSRPDKIPSCDLFKKEEVISLNGRDFLSCHGTPCHDRFSMNHTITTEFGLVGRQDYKVALVGSLYMAGTLVGAFLFGVFSDKYGRKNTLIVCTTLGGVFQVIGAMMPSYELFVFTRVMVAIGSIGMFTVGFTFQVELVNKSIKTTVGTLYQTPFALGVITIGLVALRIKDWRFLQFILAVPQLLLAIVCIATLSESPRWLMSKRRYSVTEDVLLKASRMNKVYD